LTRLSSSDESLKLKKIKSLFKSTKNMSESGNSSVIGVPHVALNQRQPPVAPENTSRKALKEQVQVDFDGGQLIGASGLDQIANIVRHELLPLKEAHNILSDRLTAIDKAIDEVKSYLANIKAVSGPIVTAPTKGPLKKQGL